MPRYKLTTRAQEGLRKSLQHVKSQFGRDAASQVRRAYLEAFRRLAENPNLGHSREELAGDLDVRFWPVGPGLVAYRAVGASIEIIAVERAERDWLELDFSQSSPCR